MKREKIERKKVICNPAKMLNQNKTTKRKRTYVSPSISILLIEMESGIAAGSGVTSPSDSNNNVKDSWDTNADRGGSLDW